MPEDVKSQHLPRLLTKDEAAAYCRLSSRTFSEWVRAGRLPRPVKDSARWDKVAIDRAIDKLSGFGAPDAPPPLTPEEKLEQFKAERAARKAAEKVKRDGDDG